MTAESVSWETLAGILATMPSVWQQLLTEHIPAGRPGPARCRACTTGGTGQPDKPWPCSVHQLAALASEIHQKAGVRP